MFQATPRKPNVWRSAQGSCWLRLIDTPQALAPLVARTRERGVEVCLRLGLICRPTREEAIRAAEAMLPDEETGRRERGILANSDSRTLQGALATADSGGLDGPAPVGRTGSLLWIVRDHAIGIATRGC